MTNLLKMESGKLNAFIGKLAEAGMTAELAEELRLDHSRMKAWVEAVMVKIAVIFTVLVEYIQPKFEDLNKSAFDWAHPDYARAKFESIDRCKDVSREKREVTFKYMTIDRAMSTDAVLAEMDRQGVRPALYEELLAFAKTNPDEQRKHPIVALGSVALVDGYPFVAYLCQVDFGRDLYLYWTDGVWRDRFRFLVARK